MTRSLTLWITAIRAGVRCAGWRRCAACARGPPRARARGFPDPNSAKAESYVTSNGAEKQKEQVLAVTVTSIEDAAPNVKLVTLRVHAREAFSFRPGQWVDFYAPGWKSQGVLHRVFTRLVRARWHVRAGGARLAKLRVRALGPRAVQKGRRSASRGSGASSSLHARTWPTRCWVAGGIGIAPLVGMLQTLVEEQRLESRGTRKKDTKSAELSPRAILLCSTKNPATQPDGGGGSRRRGEGGGRGAGGIPSHGRRTNRGHPQKSTETNHLHVSTENGRVDVKALREALRVVRGGGDGESAKPPLAFLCGPPAMSDAAEAALLELGVREEDVRLERWW